MDGFSDMVGEYAVETEVALPTGVASRELALVPNPDAASTAVVQRTVGKPFAKGQSGNPAGRKPGSRNKISELFALAMRDDFAAHGPDAIARLRERDPSAYLNLVHSMIPQAALTKCEEQSDRVDFDNMTDSDFVEMMEESEGGNNALAITKVRRDQAVALVLNGKVATMREAMTMLGAQL